MADYITTWSKIHFTPLEPREEDVSVEDIAHALSLMTRANGHFPEFYSVGQHCIACAREARAREYPARVQLYCLLHDASEAYLSDITRPVKKNLPAYVEIEAVLQEAIFRRLAGAAPGREEAGQVKDVDDSLLYYEFLHYMGEALQERAPEVKSRMEFRERPFRETEQEFLELYRQLQEEAQGAEAAETPGK